MFPQVSGDDFKKKQFPTVAAMAEKAKGSLATVPVGETISYATLAGVIGWDPQAWRGRAAVLRACRQLLREQNMLFVNVRSEGYQHVQQSEHRLSAQSRQSAARRDLNRALEMVVHTALDAMTPDQANLTLVEEVRIRLKLGLDRKLNKAKTLPTARAQIALPSGAKLVELFTRPKSA